MYNCVLSDRNISYIKKSKFFKMNLGTAITKVNETSGSREINLSEFEKHFYERYNNVPFKRGNIANISIYSCNAIKDDHIMFFSKDNRELSLEFDMTKYNNIDSYLGMCVMEVTKFFSTEKEKEINKSKEDILSKEYIDYIINKIKNEPFAMSWKELQIYKKISGNR